VRKALFIVAVPPPLHGSSQMSHSIIETFKTSFEISVINTSSPDVLRSRDFNMSKLVRGIRIIVRLVFSRRTDYELVYMTPAVNGLAFWRDIILMFWISHRLKSKKVIVHMHNKGLEFKRIRRVIFKHVNRKHTILVLSPSLIGPYQGLTTRVLKNYAPNAPKFDVSTALNRPKSKYVGFFSNLLYEKGIFDFVDIAESFRCSSVKFLVAGADGDCTEEVLKSKIKNNQIDNLDVLGAKYGQEKWHFYSTLSILLFPSKYKNECSPLVILEAIMSGVLVIAYDEGGIKDMLPKGSICLVNGKDSMQNVLEDIINDDQIFNEELASQYLHVKKEFGEDKFKSEIHSIFN
jgi:glycosyltransferase involved in cell wall biosynthesis